VAASLKFLVPFALIVAAAQQVGLQRAPRCGRRRRLLELCRL
jgi:hypothetical protein